VVAVVKLKSKMRNLRQRLKDRRDSLSAPSRSSSPGSSPCHSPSSRKFSEDTLGVFPSGSQNPSPASSPMLRPMSLGHPMASTAFRRLNLREDSPQESQESSFEQPSPESAPTSSSNGTSSSSLSLDVRRAASEHLDTSWDRDQNSEETIPFPKITIDRVDSDHSPVGLGIIVTPYTPNSDSERDRSVSFSSHMSVPSRETSRRPSDVVSQTSEALSVPYDGISQTSLSRSSSGTSEISTSTPTQEDESPVQT